MNAMEKIAFWALWIAIIIVKLPIAIVTAIMLFIERFVTWTQMRLAEWSRDDESIQAANMGIDILVNSLEDIRDDYLDMKIEL